MRNDVAVFHSKDVVAGASGVQVADKDTTLFVSCRSVGQKEFYAAYEAGLNPQIVLETSAADFDAAATDDQNAIEVTYKGKRYRVIRTYRRYNDSMEVVLGL